MKDVSLLLHPVIAISMSCQKENSFLCENGELFVNDNITENYYNYSSFQLCYLLIAIWI